MQVLSRSFLRLLSRSPNAATAPAAPVHRLSYHISASPALSRRVSPAPNSPLRHVPRNMASGVGGVKGEDLGKPDERPSAKDDTVVSLGERKAKESVACYGEENGRDEEEDDAGTTTLEAIDGNRDTSEEETSDSDSELQRKGRRDWEIERIFPLHRLEKSRHRDGSIYRDTAGRGGWKFDYRVADRRETCLESMELSYPPYRSHHAEGTFFLPLPCNMLQFFSLKLAKLHVDGGSVELYGYIAVRDRLDPLLNHVINFSRDDPIIAEQGSFINMTGPKRGIELVDTILVEYDMKIKTSKQEKDDLQLIDGVTVLDDGFATDCLVFTSRIHGESGAIDITVSRTSYAVEATIEVLITEVYKSFNLCLSCFTSGLHEEIQLFGGFIGESRGLKRSVVAVRMGGSMDLKLKVDSESSISAEHRCSFMASKHGFVIQEIKTDLALISVKVTWACLPRSRAI